MTVGESRMMERRAEIKIVCGKDLLGMDMSGKSDPYVEVYHKSQLLYKTSKKKSTLNPEWNEQFHTGEAGLITFRVIDRDFPRDDFMGEAQLDLNTVGINRSEEFNLSLRPGTDEKLAKKAEKKHKGLGVIIIRVSVHDVSDEDTDDVSAVKSFIESVSNRRSSRSFSTSHSDPEPTGMVHMVLVQAIGLIPSHSGDTVSASCKIVLGKKKRKTKIVHDSLNPKWREGIDLPWFQGQDDFIEIFIHDNKDGGEKSDTVGRAFLNLRELEPEVSHNLWLRMLDRGEEHHSVNKDYLNIEREGELHVIVTISATMEDTMQVAKNKMQVQDRFALSNTLSDMRDVGNLTVKVIKAEGISPEYVWKRNPFTVVQVGNSRVQTKYHKGTVTPEWYKTFNFDIKDVYEVVEITVFDDNGDHDYEFLGKVVIPLLNIENGKERWYRLKDKHLRKSSKGEDPRILLEMEFNYNILRASAGLFKAKSIKYEEDFEQSFEFSKFKLNARRVRKLKEHLNIQKQKMNDILTWNDPITSLCALIIASAVIWNFESWMIPLSLVIVFGHHIIQQPQNNSLQSFDSMDDEDDTEDLSDNSDGTFTMMETWERLQQRALWMQEGMGELANRLESLGNLFNFTVPIISWFIFILLITCTILLYFVPLRGLVLVWMLNKFRKGFLRQSSNNKLDNLLSRIPDNEELKDYQELLGHGRVRSTSLFSLRKSASRDSNII